MATLERLQQWQHWKHYSNGNTWNITAMATLETLQQWQHWKDYSNGNTGNITAMATLETLQHWQHCSRVLLLRVISVCILQLVRPKYFRLHAKYISVMLQFFPSLAWGKKSHGDVTTVKLNIIIFVGINVFQLKNASFTLYLSVKHDGCMRALVSYFSVFFLSCRIAIYYFSVLFPQIKWLFDELCLVSWIS